WLTTQNHSTLVTERSAVPFLPVNPEYSATRNQGRQKLARFNAREFATLIIDILSEAKRRQQGKTSVIITDNLDYSLRNNINDCDDQHDYDSVASDEDTDQELLRNSRNNRARIQKLQSENSQIRHQTGPSPPPPTNPERAEHPLPAAHRRDRQAFSMYEPGSALKPFGQSTDDLSNRLQPFHSGVNISK
ncbi:hypothetical protein AB205_0032620, partial [Aquarana catesbeiana]